MLTLTRIASTVAGLGGLLWTVKALVITARDGSFDPLEGVAFIGGLLALVAACVLVAPLLTARLRGPLRVVATAGAALGLVAATFAVTVAGQALVAAIAPGSNLGLEEEGGILLAGVAWLIVARRIAPPLPRARRGAMLEA
jgi:hypothetical protein